MIPQTYIKSRVLIEDRGYSTPCWIWKLSTVRAGYGRVHRGLGESRAHRASFRAFVGAIPSDKELDHLCRVKRCCNPDHLEPVTHRENMQRAYVAIGRREHCLRGHVIAEVGRTHRGTGSCRACQLIHKKKHRDKVSARRRAEKAAAA